MVQNLTEHLHASVPQSCVLSPILFKVVTKIVNYQIVWWESMRTTSLSWRWRSVQITCTLNYTTSRIGLARNTSNSIPQKSSRGDCLLEMPAQLYRIPARWLKLAHRKLTKIAQLHTKWLINICPAHRQHNKESSLQILPLHRLKKQEVRRNELRCLTDLLWSPTSHIAVLCLQTSCVNS